MSRRSRPFAVRLLAETLSATAASTLALALLAKAEGRGALQPLNATSHWLIGEEAARQTAWAWRTTGVGLATHFAATGFWAAIYEGWLGRRPRSLVAVAGKAAAMAGVSALVDYRATPKRFTPGWEFVLSAGAMAAAYLALAAGLAAAAAQDGVDPGTSDRARARR